MKKILLIIFTLIVLASCKQASELPPITDSYATEVIVPDPVSLTTADREYLNAMKAEYNNSIGK